MIEPYTGDTGVGFFISFHNLNQMTKEEIKIPIEMLEYLQSISNNLKTYTREEVYQVAKRSVEVFVGECLTKGEPAPLDKIINSEIDTVKLF